MTKKRRLKDLKLDLDLKRGCNHKQPYRVLIILVLLLLPTLSFAGISEQLKQTEGLVQARQYDQAEATYKAILADATDGDARLAAQKGLALLYAKSGKENLISPACHKLATDFGNHKDVVVAVSQVADECRNANRFSIAVPIYQSILDRWPGDSNSVVQQANLVTCQICLKDDKAADAAFQKLQDKYGSHPKFRYAVCTIGDNLRWRNLDTPKARQMYSVAASGELYPEILWAKMGLAISCVRIKDLDAAAPVVRNLVADFGNDPRIGQAACHIADEYRDTRHHSEAIELYQYVIDKHPQDQYAMWSQMGIAVSAIDSRDEQGANMAIERLGNEYAKHPEFAAALCVVADNYRWRDIHDKACDLYVAAGASSHPPESIWFPAGLAISSLYAGDPNTAEETLARLNSQYREDPSLAQAVYEVGCAFSGMKEFARAGQILNQVISIWPESDYALLSKAGLGLIEVRQGKEKEGEAIYQKLLTDYPNHPRLSEALFALGEQYWEQGWSERRGSDPRQSPNAKSVDCFKKALTVWERLIKEFPSSKITAQAYHFVAECYRQLGQYDKALGYYRVVVDKWPEYENASSVHFAIGHIYRNLSQMKAIPESEANVQIQKTYQRIIESYPNSAPAKPARAWLTQYYSQEGKGGQK